MLQKNTRALDVLSPRYNEIDNLLSSQQLVSKNKELYESIIGKREDWFIPERKKTDNITPAETLTAEQKEKIAFYDSLNEYFKGNVPKDLKEQWEKISQRPDITQDEIDKLKNNQKPADYDEAKKELDQWHNSFPNQDPQTAKQTAEQGKPEGLENLPSNWQEQLKELKDLKEILGTKTPQQVKEEQEKYAGYDKIKGDLDKWTSTFPNSDPIKVKEKLDAPPAVELTEEQKEAIKEYSKLKEEVKELGKRPTQEQLNQAVQQEKDKGGTSSEDTKKLKEELDKWHTAFPNQTPEKAKESQSPSVEGLPTDWKDQLARLNNLENTLDQAAKGEVKDPTFLNLLVSLRGEENKNLWDLVNNKLIKIIEEVVPKAEKPPKS